MPELFEGASPVLLLEWWKPMPGFEDSYEVSCIGNIRRTKPGRGTRTGYLKRFLNRRIGYYYVYPSRDGKNYTRRINVLVARAFHGEPPDGMVCDHVNGDKSKNWASNLEYVTQGDNVRRAVSLGLCDNNFAVSRSQSPLTEEMVRDIRFMAQYVSYAALARQFKMNPSTIRDIVRGKNWKYVS
jgi:hypothetical protein